MTDPLTVLVGNKPKFLGQAGRVNRRQAVQILDHDIRGEQMNNRLSQDEIDALLNGTNSQSEDTEQPQGANLSELERDAIGEIGNIRSAARLRRCPLF